MKKKIRFISNFFTAFWAGHFVVAFIAFYVNTMFGFSIGEDGRINTLIQTALLGSVAHFALAIVYLQWLEGYED